MSDIEPVDFVPAIKIAFSCIRDLIDGSEQIPTEAKKEAIKLLDALIVPDSDYTCDLESGLKFLITLLEKSHWSFSEFFHVAEAHRYLSEILGIKDDK